MSAADASRARARIDSRLPRAPRPALAPVACWPVPPEVGDFDKNQASVASGGPSWSALDWSLASCFRCSVQMVGNLSWKSSLSVSSLNDEPSLGRALARISRPIGSELSFLISLEGRESSISSAGAGAKFGRAR